jgi:dihydroorotate dehydrogenase
MISTGHRMYKIFIRPILFIFQPEFIHNIISIVLKIPFVTKPLKWIYHYHSTELYKEVAGLHFKNPVGLAAGFDKEAELLNGLADLGFGFLEIGTVTPKSQPGNELPRLFRLSEDQALINRMGFNNGGVEEVRKNLLRYKGDCIIGGNIGKNKTTPNEKAVDDYLICFERLHDVVDYFVVNVSSPNTPGLRELQESEALEVILMKLQEQNSSQKINKPVFLKISPDLNKSQLDDIIQVVKKTKIAGIIATNTTIRRENLKSSDKKIDQTGPGGLSGKPLQKDSTEIIRYLAEKSNHEIPIIGVGGIDSPEEALNKLKAGASLVQIYTGFIYEGPGLVKKINKFLKTDKYFLKFRPHNSYR